MTYQLFSCSDAQRHFCTLVVERYFRRSIASTEFSERNGTGYCKQNKSQVPGDADSKLDLCVFFKLLSYYKKKSIKASLVILCSIAMEVPLSFTFRTGPKAFPDVAQSVRQEFA